MDTAVWAVVPVKNPAAAKTRLATVLGAEARGGLFRAMALDVFAALAGARLLAGTLVVTRDAALAAAAREHGHEVHTESGNDGHTSAVRRGVEVLIGRGVASVLALPADLPLLQATEIDQLIDAHGRAPALSMAPAGDGQGSNGVLLSPPDAIELRFGDASCAPHLARARAAGIAPRIVHLAGFALDIDRPDDLARFAAAPSPTHAYRYLRETGLLARLAAPGERAPPSMES